MKYLGIKVNNKLHWKDHSDDVTLKLIRANAMLYKVRDFGNGRILVAICHTLF